MEKQTYTEEMRKHGQFVAIQIIVKAMCKHGFMNGWFGDVSDEFQLEKANEFIQLDKFEQKRWLKQNEFNITRYCAIDCGTLMIANG